MKKQQFLNELKKWKGFKNSIKCKGNIIMQTEKGGFDGVWKYKIDVKLDYNNGAVRDTIVFWVGNLNWDNEKILEVRWEGWHPKFDAKIRNILKGYNIRCESEAERFFDVEGGIRN